MCLACRRAPGPLCRDCRLDLRPAAASAVDGVPVFSAFTHDGAAVALVHRLKYDGVEAAAGLLASVMADLVPAETRCLVPVPRAASRRMRYGIDPGEALANRLGAVVGLPVQAALARPVWQDVLAGKGRSQRVVREYRPKKTGLCNVTIIDDVMTTGLTMQAAMRSLPGVIAGVTATRAGGTSLFSRAPS